MLSSWNLFRSDGGIELVPETSLIIVQQLVGQSPNAVKSLLLLSKSFHSLLKRYEKSITYRLSCNDERLEYANMEECIIRSSGRLGMQTVTALSYPWFSELRRRSTTIDFLASHEITQMEDSTNDWPTLDIPKAELRRRLAIFKRRAFLLLYRLADCAVGVDGTGNIRARQSVFLDNLSTQELASLGVMVEVIGQGYFTSTKARLSSKHGNSDVLLAVNSESPYFYSSTSVPYNDSISDNWIRECMCVFEDLIQRHGPYFAWAYLEGSKDILRRPDLWARSELKQGLDDMNAFELGYTMSFASLQSVVWRMFCKKASCSLQHSWIPAKELIETELVQYTLD
ncbi:hypothetical protein N431DRAFT_480062 [Stipitochalara longipes BDJ]|nr:hypothetical protein N431DRAFT_480062 [Stipitochalara longipes BDJ]